MKKALVVRILILVFGISSGILCAYNVAPKDVITQSVFEKSNNKYIKTVEDLKTTLEYLVHRFELGKDGKAWADNLFEDPHFVKLARQVLSNQAS